MGSIITRMGGENCSNFAVMLALSTKRPNGFNTWCKPSSASAALPFFPVVRTAILATVAAFGQPAPAMPSSAGGNRPGISSMPLTIGCT